MATQRAGILLRAGASLHFVPASVALRVAPPPRITAVPGAPSDLLGIALQGGVVLPVIAIGPDREEMLVCQQAGELVGLVGARVVRSGSFERAAEGSDAVVFEGERASVLDVAEIYTRVQTGGRGSPPAA
jgi:hypothetical protein